LFRELLLTKIQACAPRGSNLRTTRPADHHNFINVLGNILSKSTMADILDSLDALTQSFSGDTFTGDWKIEDLLGPTADVMLLFNAREQEKEVGDTEYKSL
jgi:hypothetical protein